MVKIINRILIIIASIILFMIPFANAYQNSLEEYTAEEYTAEEYTAEECLENFCNYINYQSDEVFKYIDASNSELYNNVETYLDNLNFDYNIKKITEDNNTYNIKVIIYATGNGWEVNGIPVNFEIKEIDNQYKITNTTLFNVIGSENIFSFVMMIFIIVAVFILINFIVVIIVVFIVFRKK